MKCNNCGTENEPGTKFCVNCGAVVQADVPSEELPPVTEAPAKKGPDLKKIGIYAGIALAAVLVIVLLANLFSGSGYPQFSQGFNALYMEDDEATTLLVGGKPLKTTIPGSAEVAAASLDRKTALIVASEDDTASLYTLVGSKLTEAVKELDSTTVYLSDNGAYYVYYADDAMYWGKVGSKGTKVAESDDYPSNITLSPDGKALAYTVSDDDGELEARLFKGKDSEKISKNLIPLVISNSGKYIYGLKQDEGTYDLYCYNAKGEGEKISAEVSRTVSTNKDHTQLIFTGSDGKSYAVVKKGEKQKVTSSSLWMVTPDNTQVCVNGTAVVYGVSDLRNHVFSTGEGDLVYVNGKWEADKLVSNVSDGRMSDDGKTILYCKKDKVYSIKAKKGAEGKELAEDVMSTRFLPDGKSFYWEDEDGVLYFQKGKGKAKKVAEDVQQTRLTHDGYLIFQSDDEWYYSKNGGKKTKLSDEISYVSTGMDYTIYKDEDGNYYYTAKGMKFKKI